MRLLVDTHILLWAAVASRRMCAAAREAIVDPANEVFVSAIAAWEIVIKHNLGKLDLPIAPAAYFARRMRASGYRELPFSLAHAVAQSALPNIHADPFDRAMIAQAQVEDLTFVTADPVILRYGMNALDARL